MRPLLKYALVCLLSVGLLWPLAGVAQGVDSRPAPIPPGPKDKCPVCGMFAAKYPDFLAEVIFTDGTYAIFDGVKDMMKFCLNLKKYRPAMRQGDIAAVYVTDYYRMVWIDGQTCFYVAGSDVYGPMGRELVPFEKKSDAEQFMQDHGGQKILTFDAIDTVLIKSLD